jgi:hypothetical protein
LTIPASVTVSPWRSGSRSLMVVSRSSTKRESRSSGWVDYRCPAVRAVGQAGLLGQAGTSRGSVSLVPRPGCPVAQTHLEQAALATSRARWSSRLTATIWSRQPSTALRRAEAASSARRAPGIPAPLVDAAQIDPRGKIVDVGKGVSPRASTTCGPAVATFLMAPRP